MREGALAGVVAGHLFHGSAVAEPWAVDILVEAAGEEVRAGRPRCAVAYLRRALDEPMAPVRRATVLIQLGSLECAAHPSGGLARLAQAVRLPGESRDRVRAMVALATALARSGETGEALRLLREEEQRLAGRPGLVRTLRAVAVLMSDATPDALRPEHEAPLPESDGDGPDLLDAARRMQAVRHGATAGLISSRDAMDRIRALTDGPADPLAVPFLFGMAALVAHWADELDEAEQLVRRALDPLGSFLLHPMHHILTDVRVDLAAARADHDTVLAEPSARTPRIRSSGPGPTSAHTQAVIALVETDGWRRPPGWWTASSSRPPRTPGARTASSTRGGAARGGRGAGGGAGGLRGVRPAAGVPRGVPVRGLPVAGGRRRVPARAGQAARGAVARRGGGAARRGLAHPEGAGAGAAGAG